MWVHSDVSDHEDDLAVFVDETHRVCEFGLIVTTPDTWDTTWLCVDWVREVLTDHVEHNIRQRRAVVEFLALVRALEFHNLAEVHAAVDLRGLAKEHGREVMRNTAGVGVTAALLDLDLEHIEDLMSDAMGGDVLEANLEILHDAYEMTEEDFEFEHDLRAPTGDHDTEQALLSGSNAIAYGAIDAAVQPSSTSSTR